VDDAVELAAVEPVEKVGWATTSARRRLATFRHFSPLSSQSFTATSAPPSSRLATTFDPINPAPPVTRNMLTLAPHLPSFAPDERVAQTRDIDVINHETLDRPGRGG
jgi:hypothetical protein